jgi:hypothetical protein
MIDVNKITSTLAKLQDPQLQQYAQMHKNDPYIMALAMSESNRRKELRAASQGAQGMQEQPKVVDQMVAAMAPQQMPEDQGIGQLPAGDMNFAGGGIIAFADGGDVERYSGMYGSLTGDIPGFVAGTGNFIPQAGAPEEVPLFRRMFREARATGANYQVEQAKARIAAGVGTSADEAILAAAQPARSTAPSPQDMAQFDAASNLYMTERAAKQAAAAPKAPGAAPTADTGRKAPAATAGAVPRAAGPRAPAQAGLGDLATLRQDILNKQQFTDPASAGLKELEARELAAAQEDKASLLRDQAKFDDAYKGREKRLSDRELDIGKQKDANTGLAFLNAGLAIMSTPGGLATAIGKGAQVGTAQFAAGLDKIRSAQERLDEARDKMEDLKLNRAEMSAKEIRAAEKGIRNVGVDAQKRTIDGIRMAADVNEKRATAIYTSTVEVGINRERMSSAEGIAAMQEGGANARAAAQIAASLNTPDRALWDQLMKKNGNDATKALEEFKLVKGDKFDVRSSYADYLKAFAGKEGLTPPMSMGAYAGQFGATLPR